MPKKPAPAEIPADLAPAADLIARGEIPTSQLVEAAFALKAQIAFFEGELAQVEAKLIARGPGKHTGNDDGHEVTVVAASEGKPGNVSYQLGNERDDAAKVEQARALALDKFGVLFTRSVTFTPIEGFASVVPTHLTPAKSRDLLALCAVQGKASSGRKAYLLYPKIVPAKL